MEKQLQKDLLKAIRNAIAFPYSQICKHVVAADLLSVLEKHGVEVSKELADAVVSANDEEALTLLASAIAKLAD